MIKKNIIYDNLIRLLEELVATYEGSDAAIAALGDKEQALLLSHVEQVDKAVKEIAVSRDLELIHPDFGSLLSSIEVLQSILPTARVVEILLLIEFIDRLRESVEGTNPDLGEDLDTTQFEVVELDRPIRERNFFYQEVGNPGHFFILIDPTNLTELSGYLTKAGLPSEMILQLIAKVGNDAVVFPSRQCVLINSGIANNKSKVFSTVALCLVKDGKIVHSPELYTALPTIPVHQKVAIGSDYQQFDDTLQILSEYNDHEDILDKFLRLYHVFENFMYKLPLVDMERRHGGDVFSIRDFKRMSDAIGDRELKSLTDLFKKVAPEVHVQAIPPQPNITVQEFIHLRINSLRATHFADVTNLNRLFGLLRLKKKLEEAAPLEFSHINTANSAKHFAQIVYSIRNSIVHNRETEFHLTHETLRNHSQIGDSAAKVIGEFVIPTMEEIVFSLIITPNQLVWFQNDFLRLWKK